MTADTEEVVARLGSAIRARRRMLGLTLVDVAAAAGLSHPFLSQLERGLARPSMRSLTAIAATLGTTAQALMAASGLPGETGPAAPAGPGTAPAGPGTAPAGAAGAAAGGAGPVSLVRHGSGASQPVESPGGTVRALVRGERAMLPVEYIGAPREFDEYYRHDGEEFVYVVAGVIEVDIEGELRIASAGDSVYYAGGMRHRWRGVGAEEVRLVVVQQNVPPAPPPPAGPGRPGS